MIKPWYCALLFALATLLFGPLLPLLQNGRVAERFVNVVWDSLYGLGFHIAYLISNQIVLSRPVGFVGGILWPALLFAFVFYCARSVAAAKWHRNVKVIVTLCLCLTFLLDVKCQQAVFWRLPLFTILAGENY